MTNVFGGTPPKPNPYGAWGNQADVAQKQGWYPETQYGDATVYRNPYGLVFNKVIVDNSPTGHVALIGHNNQKFDVVIRDKDGNIKSTIFKGISPDQVQKYITDSNSNVSTRTTNIQKTAIPIDVASSK